MGKYEWDNTLSVGIELIDEQHKSLIQRLNDVNDAIEESLGETQIVRTLEFLIEYTNYHFATEEKNMATTGYPGIDDHKRLHSELIANLKDLEDDFKDEGATHILAESINKFLNYWLIKHIKGIDIQFGDFLKEKGLDCTE